MFDLQFAIMRDMGAWAYYWRRSFDFAMSEKNIDKELLIKELFVERK
jgi:hypothetical protein